MDATWTDHLIQAYLDNDLAKVISQHVQSNYDPDHPMTVHLLLTTGVAVEVTP